MTQPGFSLAQVQAWMQGALQAPSSVSPADAEKLLVSINRFSGAEGLGVYQRSYFLRIASCMREQFPALCHALGEGLFNDFVAEYIREAPPESYTLYDLGRRFPGFLNYTRPDKDAPEDEREVWIDFMIDLARFERQVFVMFDAPGNEGNPYADPETPDDALRLQPCFDLGHFRFPVAHYYHDVRAERDPPLPPIDETFVALVRRDYLTRTIPLSAPHFRFLAAMKAGHSVDLALAEVSDATGTPFEEVKRLWAARGGVRDVWMDAGFFVSVGGKVPPR